MPNDATVADAAPQRDPQAIKHYHAHVCYDPSTRERAAQSREQVAAVFPYATLGRWHDAPVGPHPQSMYQIAFPAELLASFLPWLMLNRAGLIILLDPRPGTITPTIPITPLGSSLGLLRDRGRVATTRLRRFASRLPSERRRLLPPSGTGCRRLSCLAGDPRPRTTGARISASRKLVRGGREGQVSSQPLCWYAAPRRPEQAETDCGRACRCRSARGPSVPRKVLPRSRSGPYRLNLGRVTWREANREAIAKKRNRRRTRTRSRPLPRHRRRSRPSESTRAAKAARQAREAADARRSHSDFLPIDGDRSRRRCRWEP
jgi:aromatic ring-cleaving dioxygenase